MGNLFNLNVLHIKLILICSYDAYLYDMLLRLVTPSDAADAGLSLLSDQGLHPGPQVRSLAQILFVRAETTNI